MKSQWKKIAAAAAIACAGPASAIPVTFDFSGTIAQDILFTGFPSATPVFDFTRTGQAFSAQFIIDTDLFGAPFSASAANGDRLTFNAAMPGAITGSLVINGESINLAPFDQNNSFLTFLDSNGPFSCGVECTGIAPDQWNTNLTSTQISPFGGPAASRSLGFSFVSGFQGLDNPEPSMNWFDFTPEFGIDQISLLPMRADLRANLFLSENFFECGDERCQQTSSLRTQFAVTSATRTVTSVPEPGTLGLLAMGAACMMFATRRRREVRI